MIRNKQAWLNKQTIKLNNSSFKTLNEKLAFIDRENERVYLYLISELSLILVKHFDDDGLLLNRFLYEKDVNKILDKVEASLTRLADENNKLINKELEYFKTKITKDFITMFEEAEKLGVLTKVDIDLLTIASSFPYAKYNFVSNLNNGTLYVKDKLNKLLIKNIINKPNAIKLTKEIEKVFNLNKYIAKRIARTELSRVFNTTSRQMYTQRGLRQVKYLDSTENPGKSGKEVCDVCKERANYNDGIYSLDTAPIVPTHPNCRCCYAPYITDDQIINKLKL